MFFSDGDTFILPLANRGDFIDTSQPTVGVLSSPLVPQAENGPRTQNKKNTLALSLPHKLEPPLSL
jgi:hypothetical protein